MTPWGRAITALRLLEVDPDGLGGILVQARSGPARDTFQAELGSDLIRLHPSMPKDTLRGGIDVAASLANGRLVHTQGLLDRTNVRFVLTMAERVPGMMASTLANALDRQTGNTLIALDEHVDDEAPLPDTLADRLAFHVSLEGVGQTDIQSEVDLSDQNIALKEITIDPDAMEVMVTLAVTLGISSLRAPMLALNAARAHAARCNRGKVEQEDLAIAAELVLAPRATRMPQDVADTPPPPDPDQAQSGDPTDQPEATVPPQDLLLAAIATALPPDLLTKTGSNTVRNGQGSGAGRKRIGNRRGRPLPARDTPPRGDARVDLMATLRAAVPWQTMRKMTQPDRTGPIIHPTDLRHRRYEDLSDRLLVFAVDASGSAAIARLAEAKGAVELLLAEAYARRDHVALISFRGTAAEVLLPPTRSLVQTKRRLAELPGGGGTPLASGLNVALETAQGAFRKGLSPVIIVLTDGRSNITLDGTPDRARAAADVTAQARQIAQAGIDSIVIDTSRRPEPSLRELALSLRGHYASLPRADAHTLSDTITTALQA